jgi:hypothetical protein
MWVRLGPSGAASIGDRIAAMETGRAALRPNENQRLTHALLAAALAHINRLKDPSGCCRWLEMLREYSLRLE